MGGCWAPAVKEGTISWAPWTRPTMGCISHLHTTPTLLQLLCKPHCAGLALPQASRQAPCCRSVWGRAEARPGWSLFLPLEITGPLQVWSHLCAFISLAQTETRPFSLQAVLWGTVRPANVGKADAVDTVSFLLQVEAWKQQPIPCLPLYLAGKP